MDHSESDVDLLDLPFEILCKILSYLSQDDIFWNVGFTCQILLQACLENVQFIQVSKSNYIVLIYSSDYEFLFLSFLSIHLMIIIFERSLEKRVAQEILIKEVVQSKRMIPFTIKSFKKVSSGILLNLYDMNL